MATTIKLGKVSFTPRGTFVLGTQYYKQDLVADNNGNTYMAIADSKNVAQTDSTKWQMFIDTSLIQNATQYIANTYSASEPYAVGDYAIHSGKFYVCTTAIPSGEKWTASHWRESNLADELNTEISNLEQTFNSYRTITEQNEIDEQQDSKIEGKAPYSSGIYFGKCSSSASAQAKTVTIDGITELEVGTMILVWFIAAQTYNGAPTLNVNSLGAKNIARLSGSNAARYEWSANEILLQVYDGTRWVIIDGGQASTSYYGVTKLTTSATSTNTATALTPASLDSFAGGMIADYPHYSTSSTYAVGDRVRYAYGVYECITAITDGEAWTAAHWKELSPLINMIEEKILKVVDVVGTRAIINGENNTQYLCGSLTTLQITAPTSGIIDIMFTSGATATTLTSSGVVWPLWFNSSSLTANTVYEINIMNGYAAVATWPATR